MLKLDLFFQVVFTLKAYCSSEVQADSIYLDYIDNSIAHKKDPRGQIDYLLCPQGEDSTSTYQFIPNKDSPGGNATSWCSNLSLDQNHKVSEDYYKKEIPASDKGCGNLSLKIVSIRDNPTITCSRVRNTTILYDNRKLESNLPRTEKAKTVHGNKKQPRSPKKLYKGPSIWTTVNQLDGGQNNLDTIDLPLELPFNQRAIPDLSEAATTVMAYPHNWSAKVKSRLFFRTLAFKDTGVLAALISDQQAVKQLYGSSGNIYVRLSKAGMLIFEWTGHRFPNERIFVTSLKEGQRFQNRHPLIPWIVNIDKAGVTAVTRKMDTIRFQLIKDDKIIPFDSTAKLEFKKGDIILAHSKALDDIKRIARYIRAARDEGSFRSLKRDFSSLKRLAPLLDGNKYDSELLIAIFKI